MTSAIRLYLKSFVFMGVPFGASLGLFVGIERGLSIGLNVGVTAGLSFGFLGCLLSFFHILKVRRLGGVGSVSPFQTASVKLHTNLDRAFDKCLKGFERLEMHSIVSDKANWKIVGKTGLNWQSFGETITIQIQDSGDETVNIQISSAPKIRTTLIDFGKGLRNIQSVVRILND